MLNKKFLSAATAAVMALGFAGGSAFGAVSSFDTAVLASADFIPVTGWVDVIEPYVTDSFTKTTKKDSDSIIINGDEYVEGFYFTSSYRGGSTDYDADLLFNLDGKYNKFSFDLGHIKDSAVYNVSCSIFVNGEIVQKKSFDSFDSTAHFDVDLKNAKQLKIEFKTSRTGSAWESYAKYGIVNGSWTKSGASGTTIGDSNWLTQCSYETTRAKAYSKNGDYLLMGGNKYYNSVAFYSGTESAVPYEGKMEFPLNGKFEKFTFTLGAIDGTRRHTTREFTVLLDGKVANTFTIDSEALPIAHTVSLKGVNKMELVLNRSESEGNWYEFAAGIGEANFVASSSGSRKIGDLNDDNKIDIDDLMVMQKYVAGWIKNYDKTVADLDGNGDVDVNDLVLMQKKVAGWNVTFAG